MNDLISRQWLMECVNEGWVKFDTEKDENRFIHLVRDIAPTVQTDRPEYFDKLWQKAYEEGKAAAQPERIRGRWIDKDGGLATCSVCGVHWGVWSVMQFCPNCGADMREATP